MSVFETDTNSQPNVDDTNQPQDTTEKRLKDKDDFIERLKGEQADLRAELERIKLDKEMADLRNQVSAASRSTTPQANQDTKPAAAPAITDDDLVNRIKQVTQAMSVEERQATNEAEAARLLVEQFGDEAKAGQYVSQKAAELGVSVAFLKETAKQSPKAFFTTIGLNDTAPKGVPTATRSDVNTAALNSANPTAKEGTYAYYQELKRTDPKRYFSPNIQNQMHRDALKVGEAFFN